MKEKGRKWERKRKERRNVKKRVNKGAKLGKEEILFFVFGKAY